MYKIDVTMPHFSGQAPATRDRRSDARKCAKAMRELYDRIPGTIITIEGKGKVERAILTSDGWIDVA